MGKQYEWWGAENSKQVYNLSRDLSEQQNIIIEREDVYDRLIVYLNNLRRDGSSKGFNPDEYSK